MASHPNPPIKHPPPEVPPKILPNPNIAKQPIPGKKGK